MAKVLVVDDDPAMVATLVRMLESAGHKAVPCSSGEVGIAILRREAFDLVLTDILMPDLDGAELTRKLREILPGLPVVLMSGAVMNAELPDGTSPYPGASALLHKPFRTKELLDVMEMVLGMSCRRIPDRI